MRSTVSFRSMKFFPIFIVIFSDFGIVDFNLAFDLFFDNNLRKHTHFNRPFQIINCNFSVDECFLKLRIGLVTRAQRFQLCLNLCGVDLYIELLPFLVNQFVFHFLVNNFTDKFISVLGR